MHWLPHQTIINLLMENERVRVLDTIIRPGETTPVHTHPDPSVFYIISWSDFVRYDDQGDVLLDTRDADSAAQPPSVLWGEIMPPHAVENVGDADLHVIGVEVKD